MDLTKRKSTLQSRRRSGSRSRSHSRSHYRSHSLPRSRRSPSRSKSKRRESLIHNHNRDDDGDDGETTIPLPRSTTTRLTSTPFSEPLSGPPSPLSESLEDASTWSRIPLLPLFTPPPRQDRSRMYRKPTTKSVSRSNKSPTHPSRSSSQSRSIEHSVADDPDDGKAPNIRRVECRISAAIRGDVMGRVLLRLLATSWPPLTRLHHIQETAMKAIRGKGSFRCSLIDLGKFVDQWVLDHGEWPEDQDLMNWRGPECAAVWRITIPFLSRNMLTWPTQPKDALLPWLRRVWEKESPCRVLTRLLFRGSDRKHYAVVEWLGAGANGFAVLVKEEKTGVEFVLKTGNIEPSEILIQKQFADLGMAPRIMGERRPLTVSFAPLARIEPLEVTVPTKFLTSETWQISMERIDGTLVDWLLDRSRTLAETKAMALHYLSLLDTLAKHGLSHGDSHAGNVGYRTLRGSGTELLFIDFGYASAQGHVRLIELLQQQWLIPHMRNRFRKQHEARIEELSKIKAESAEETSNITSPEWIDELIREEDLEYQSRRPIVKSILDFWRGLFWGLAMTQFPKSMGLLFPPGEVVSHKFLGKVMDRLNNKVRPWLYKHFPLAKTFSDAKIYHAIIALFGA